MGVARQLDPALRRGLRFIERTDGATLYHVVFGQGRRGGDLPRLSFADIDATERGERPWLALGVSAVAHVALIALLWPSPETVLPPEREPREGIAIELVTAPGMAPRDALRAVPTASPIEQPVAQAAPAQVEAVGVPGDRPAPDASLPVAQAEGIEPAPDITRSAVADTRVAPAAAPGGARAKSSEEEAWEGAILGRIIAKKRYPRVALSDGAEDTVMVRLVLDRDGELVRAELARSRGHAALDREVLALAKRASPFPRPPASVPGETVALLVPVEFVITKRR